MLTAQQEAAKRWAKEMNRSRNTYVSSWDKVTPKESDDALSLVNSQLKSQNMDAVSNAVFRWRMLHAIRYEKKRKGKARPHGKLPVSA